MSLTLSVFGLFFVFCLKLDTCPVTLPLFPKDGPIRKRRPSSSHWDTYLFGPRLTLQHTDDVVLHSCIHYLPQDVVLARFGCVAWCPRMSVDILGTSWDQCRSMVQYSFTFTEARRLVRTDSPGRPPRLSHSSWTVMCGRERERETAREAIMT